MSREGIPQFGWMGFKGLNTAKPPLPYFSVRMKHLGHLGLKIPAEFIGGSMTWDELGSIILRWGTNETLLYTVPQPGWTYKWDIGLGRFIVTDSNGNATIHEHIKTISDLGISWDILESPQFSIHLTANFENTAFLIGWRYKKGYPPNPDDPYYPDDPDNPVSSPEYYGITALIQWSEVDKYLNSVLHIVYGRLIESSINDGGNQDASVTIDLTGYFRDILFAEAGNLTASSNYPLDLYKASEAMTGNKEFLMRYVEMAFIGDLLMIHLFASISNGSKPVFEPWMLWELWRWLGQGTVVISRDRTFDLSPWWG